MSVPERRNFTFDFGANRGNLMQFYFFHLMPYPYMPEDYLDRYETSWATIPNELYDPEIGHQLYNDYLDVFEAADRLGYDGICVNEHHQTCYGLMPSPNIMAGALARRTNNAKIAILGNAICLRDHPLRVAEEVAMLDVITKGRIISGFVRGVGDEYISSAWTQPHRETVSWRPTTSSSAHGRKLAPSHSRESTTPSGTSILGRDPTKSPARLFGSPRRGA